MRNSILVRSIAAVSGIVMLASVAACGDNTTASTDSSAKSDTKTETVSGNFSGAGASSQQAAVEAWIAGFQGTNPDAKGRLQPVRFRRWRVHLPDRCNRMGRLRRCSRR